MNQGVGLSLYVAYFPQNLLKFLDEEKGFITYQASWTGRDLEGLPFRIVQPFFDFSLRLSGVVLRKVILVGGVKIDPDQRAFLITRRRVTSEGDFIVEERY